MSQENAEIVKRGLDAFERLDVDALVELTTADFEWLPSLVQAVEGGSFRGRDGIEKYVTEFRETWEYTRICGTPELRDLGDDRVLVLGRVMTRGAGSGVSVEAPLGQLYEFRDGKISCVRTYLDHEEALRAAGLTE